MATCPECDENVRTRSTHDGDRFGCRHCGARLVQVGEFPNAALRREVD